VDTRNVTLTLSYDIQPGFNGQQVDVTVDDMQDDFAPQPLQPISVTVRQEISFGRPQLPTLSFDVAQGSSNTPRGVLILGGVTTDYAFDPIVTRIVTDEVYIETEPEYDFTQWFPTQPAKINRLGSHIGDGGNQGQLVLYPAQYQSAGGGLGTLRAFDQVNLRIYYDDPSALDTQAPVIQSVEALPGSDQVEITLEVIDPDPGVGTVSGVTEVWLAYSLDDVHWASLAVPYDSGDTWRTTIGLPTGVLPEQLTFVVQAVDGAGNVAYSANKGESYSGAEGTIFLPLVLR